jgi:hypothetical protein
MTMPRLSKKERSARAIAAIDEILDLFYPDDIGVNAETLGIFVLVHLLAGRIGLVPDDGERISILSLVVARIAAEIAEAARLDEEDLILAEAATHDAVAELTDGATTH